MLQQRRIAIVILTVCLMMLFAPSYAQSIAGIRANGKIVSRGDTINVCKGYSILYRSVAQNAIAILWKFNNGIPSGSGTANPAAVVYNTPGIDSTIQYVSDAFSADSMYIFIRVSDTHPIAAFTASPSGQCADVPVQFNNLSTGTGLSYQWNFGDGSTSTLTNPSHQFLNATGTSGLQTYSVNLLVTNAFNCAAVTAVPVSVMKIPDASIGVNDNTILTGTTFNGLPAIRKCSNLPFYTFNFTNESTTPSINVSYNIQWGDGTDTTFTTWPAGDIMPHTYPLGSDTMTIRIIGADGCVGIKSYYIFLGSTPSGGLNSLGNEDICSDDSLHFAITPFLGTPNPPGTTFSFVVNDGTPPQVFNYPPPGTVGHFFKNGSCSYVSNYGLSTYNNAYGAYLTIQNACGEKSFAVVPIYVSGKPRASFVVNPSNIVCRNSTTVLQSTSAYGAIVSASNPLCTNSGKQVWVISPSTGYTLTGGLTGSLNGNATNGNGWTNGTPALSVIFTNTGTYTVKLYVYNNRCGIDSTVKMICVRNPPEASFTMSAKSSCGQGSAKFTNTSPSSSCLGDDYDWKVTYSDPAGCNNSQTPSYQFISGSSNNSVSPEIQFNNPGMYIVRLTTTAKNSTTTSCAPAFTEDTFYVKGPPNVAINPLNSICLNNAITPTANVTSCYSPGPLQYQWTFDNGSPSTSTDPAPSSIAYSTLGTFPVKLTVTDLSCNTSSSASVNVQVISLPAVNAGTDQNICSGATVGIGMTGTAGVTYQWSPVTGLSDPTVSNPTATLTYTGPADDTTYGFRLVASIGANCSDADSIYIKVRRKPMLTVLPADLQICTGNSINLQASGADSYNWSPAESLDNANTASVIASPTATIIYTLRGDMVNGCVDSLHVQVKVNPDAKALFIADPGLKCSGINLQDIIKTTTYPGNGSYTWYVNNILIGTNNTGAFPDYSLNVAGQTVVIKLVTQSPFGCKPDSMEMTFTIIPAVTPQFNKSAGNGCGPLKVYFQNTSTILNNVQFSWNFGNGITSTLTQPDSITFNNNPFNRDTIYYISLKAFNGCDTTYYRDSIKVFANPRALFNAGNLIGCSPFTTTISNVSLGNNFVYYWDFDDGNRDTTYTTGSFKHTFYTGIIDTFRIRLTAVNQCGSHSDSLDVVVSPSSIQPQVAINGSSISGCAPHAATFINHSIGAALLIINYQDGSNQDIIAGTENQFTHTFNNPGTYNVSIRLVNNCSDTTITRPVTVLTPPVTSFSLSKKLICTGEMIQTNNTSQNGNSYIWYWGDSTSSTGFNASHTYTKAGSYEVRLAVTLVNNFGAACSVIAPPVTVNVVDMIAAKMDTSSNKPCAPYSVTLSAAATQNAKSVSWVFYDSTRAPGIFYANGTTASYQYNNPGQYEVKLITENAAGCKDSITHLFTVYPTPKIKADPFIVYTCNTDTLVSLLVDPVYTGTDKLSYKWFINDTMKVVGSPFGYRFRLPAGSPSQANYAIKEMVENKAGCYDSALVGNLIIRPLLKPAIQVSPGSILYQPDYTFTFKDSVIAGLQRNYLWNFGDGKPTSKEKEVTHVYGDTGTYRVLLKVNDEVTGCVKSDTTPVCIRYIPGYLYVADAICPGCSKSSLRYFLPKGWGLKEYRLRIFNSLGQKIFETTSLDAGGSPNEPWYATWKNSDDKLQQDMYMWQIEARYINETEWKGMLYPGKKEYKKEGFITVIR